MSQQSEYIGELLKALIAQMDVQNGLVDNAGA